MLPIQLHFENTNRDQIGSRAQDKAKTYANLPEDRVSVYTDVTESDTFLGDKIEFQKDKNEISVLTKAK